MLRPTRAGLALIAVVFVSGNIEPARLVAQVSVTRAGGRSGALADPQMLTPVVLPPATRLEAFLPAPGTVLTYGYDELGRVGGISVEVRELRDSLGNSARGLLVAVGERDAPKEVSFVDADEIPTLVKGLDALLEVRSNPTAFRNFEVRYVTRGELQLTAFSSNGGGVVFAVQAGRAVKSERVGLGVSEMVRLRALLETASQKLASLDR